MTETTDYPIRRHSSRRADDNGWKRVLAWAMRWRGLGAVVWGVSGSILTALAMRFFLVTQLNAQSARITYLETQTTLTSAKMDTLTNRVSGLTRGICLQLTRADQDFGNIGCPTNLYKGASR